MPIIKRYSNRKLYDMHAKRYVTLADIASMIRSSEEVTVLEHATNEDITSQIQAQIIFEQQRHPGPGLPTHVLSSLIQASNQTLKQLRASLWFRDWAWQVDSEIERRINLLLERGDLSKKQAGTLLAKLESIQPDASRPRSDRALERALARRGTPTRSEFQELIRQVGELTRELERLDTPPRKRPRRGKPRAAA